jgi:hypothetical protein
MLTISAENAPSLASFEVFHGNRPTLDSNVVAMIAPPFGNSPDVTNTPKVVVSGGVEYHIAVSAPPITTELRLKLTFESLEEFSGASASILEPLFRSGTSPWIAESNVFHFLPGALEVTRNSSSDAGYIEAVFPGPGTLTFWWKSDGGVADELSVFVNKPPVERIFPPTPRISGTNGWSFQSVALPNGTNVVRWTADASVLAKSRPPAKAWLDDVQFTSSPPLPPQFLTSKIDNNGFHFAFISEASRTYSVEISTNLRQWIDWTNFYSATSSVNSFAFPTTNLDAVFFRGKAR